MASTYRPRVNAATAARKRTVSLDTNVNGQLGKMIVTVAGYGQVPAAANNGTGKMAGIIIQSNDNTGGAQGALSVITEDGEYDFANSGTNPCSAATVGLTVYAADGDTISTNSGDGPPAGTLVAYSPSDVSVANRPCRVRLKCEN